MRKHSRAQGSCCPGDTVSDTVAGTQDVSFTRMLIFFYGLFYLVESESRGY